MKHWSNNLTPEMNTEKLQLLAISCISTQEKESILQIWNSPKSVCVAKRFPVAPFTNSTFLLYLHRYVFWSQLKTAALEQLPSLLEEARCNGLAPSISISLYIDSSKVRQWKYAFSEQIKNREINKSVDWESSKNIHGEGAIRCLIYRYWLHILLKEGIALEEPPNFVDWCDPENHGFMFMAKQEESWTNANLKLCH